MVSIRSPCAGEPVRSADGMATLEQIKAAAGHVADPGTYEHDAAVAIAMVLRAAAAAQAQIEERLKRHGITFARYNILNILYHSDEGSMNPGVIARSLYIDPSSVTSAVTRLNRDGLVLRRVDEDNRRMTIVEITTEGSRLYEKAVADLRAIAWGCPDVEPSILRETSLNLAVMTEAIRGLGA